MADEAQPQVPADLLERWGRSYETAFGAWSTALSDALRDGGRYLDPFGLYRQWLDDQAEGPEPPNPAGPASAGPGAFSRQVTEATGETWRRTADLSAALARLAPRWVELAEGFRKQLLEGGLPTDPLDLVARWYEATSGPLSAMIRDLLSDEAYLESSRRVLENYATLDTLFRRFSEEFLHQLQVSTSSDSARIAALIVGLDEKVDRLEETVEDLDPGSHGSRAVGQMVDDEAAQLRGRLDRLEEKLDRLLALAPGDGGSRGAAGRRRRGEQPPPRAEEETTT